MKKNILILFMTALIAISIIGCSNKSTEEIKTVDSEVVEELQDEQEVVSDETEDLQDIEAVADIEVDKNLFNVELTIPKDFVEEMSQAEMDELAKEKGYKSITLNEDGSATYIMTKSQHKELLESIVTSINDSLAEMTTSGEYSFTDITANDNFTDFVITTTSTELNLQDSFSVMLFYMYGGMYSVFSGESIDNVHVAFVNADSGEIISEADSKDME